MKRDKIISLLSFIIMLLTLISIIMFLLKQGIIIKATSKLLNNEIVEGYRAWDLIYKNKTNAWGIIGFNSLILGGISVLLTPLNSYRFLLSFILLLASSIITYLLPTIINLSSLDWGDLLTIKAMLGFPLFMSLLIQILATVTSGILFIISYKNY